ncbi:MAG: ATP-binding protein [Gammaproteobacteria bacterium]
MDSDAAAFVELDHRTPEQTATLVLERLALNEGYAKDHYTKNGEPEKTSIPNNLPRLQYFFGREADLKKIADALAPDARGWGALVDGPGGIGKTSLAIRAAELVPHGRFRRIIFLSSKERELTADGQRSLGSFVLPGYLEMLNAIARELDQPDLAKSPEAERSDAILRALRDADPPPVVRAVRASTPSPSAYAASATS